MRVGDNITVMRSDRAKYASNALWQRTPEENKETADGTTTYFGTYSISEADSSITFTSKEVHFQTGMARIRSVWSR